MNNSKSSDPSNDDASLTVPGFDDLALHLTHQPQQLPPRAVPKNETALPVYNETALPVYLEHSATPSSPQVLPWQQLPAVATLASGGHQPRDVRGFDSRNHQGADASRSLEPAPHQERFSSDPRDDVLLKWADGARPWWHFDVEARMVDPETLWITEKLVEFFNKYLKPVWWGRFVEGLNDFFGMVFNELIRPVWSLFAVPLVALAKLLSDVDWPWNFELRGAHVSVKQSPFRRIIFDNRASPELIDRLWSDPDAFLEAGQPLKKDDRTTVARVPLRQPGTTGRFAHAAIGVLKRFNLRELGHTLSHLLWFTRASRSWVYGREMLEAGLNTARPLAMVEDRIGPFRFRSFVLTEYVDGVGLDKFLKQTPLSTTELDRLASQFADIWHTLGEMRLAHGDLKASNFMVTADRQLKLIDLDGTWRHWFDVTYLPRRDRDWLRFMKNWKGRPEVAAAFRAAVARHFDERLSEREMLAARPLILQKAA